jgi:hypothetical protein
VHRAGWDAQITQYGDATFYVTGQAHSIVGRVSVGADAVASGAAGGVGDARTMWQVERYRSS